MARALRALVESRTWQDDVRIHREICLGYCHQGPNVMLCKEVDAWGRAPLAGTPGCESLHHMNEAALIIKLEQHLAPEKDVRTARNGAKG